MLSKARQIEAKILGFNTTLKKNIKIQETENELLFISDDKLLGGISKDKFLEYDLPKIWSVLKLGEDDVKEPI